MNRRSFLEGAAASVVVIVVAGPITAAALRHR